jgi:adenylate cyclase
MPPNDEPHDDASGMKLVVRTGDKTRGVFDLVDGTTLTLGASSQVDCHVPGERYLSRRHVVLRPARGKLEVEHLESASNPVLFKGSITRRFRMLPGEYFVVGKTEFHLHAPANHDASKQDDDAEFQFTLGVEEMRSRHGSGDRMRLLDLMELPEVLRTRSRLDFFVYASSLLRMASGATWVGVLTIEPDGPTLLAEDAGIDRSQKKPLSRGLVNAALEEIPKPVTHCSWNTGRDDDVKATAHEGIDWSICCAMPVPGEAPILFYLAGAAIDEPGRYGVDRSHSAQLVLRDTARLVGLVADMIGRAISLQTLESWQSRLGHFFSDKLVAKILEADAHEELAPRITEATVMFFDIRGFSRLTEGKLERMLDHQDDLRQVMTAMTQCVFDHDGVVIRYMGDGILCCWNVPYDLSDHVDQACLAALSMAETMEQVAEDWGCGIGLGVGDVVAGSLGSEQVYAFDILGAVVNQAARIEAITKIIEVPILVSGEVAARVSSDRVLTRRVARFQPAGMDAEIDLFTIERTPDDPAVREAIEKRFAVHAKGLEAFEAGDWNTAFNVLHPIVQEDPASRYVYTRAIGRKAPPDWHGVIVLTDK